MTLRASIGLLALAALLTAVSSFAAEATQHPSCKKPEYPKRAQKAGQDGITVLGFLVRADGKVEKTVILSSAGSRELDRTAELALSQCVYRREVKMDDAIGLWIRTSFTWSFLDDPDMLQAKHATAVAASAGNRAARYHLSLLLWSTAKTDADRVKAMVVLRSAAELGHAHAQYDLGQRYEKGEGVGVDREEAVRWYEKSAAQGDPLARQRLTLGILGS